ncbi:MAG: sodium/proton-translocating pyrophosphatase, partial [Candidatus Nealsonbacteria bacterium]|nr:sodium/proton-translocating pyrophosphatase [Candidatus Nealsonbacteria bacterium]
MLLAIPIIVSIFSLVFAYFLIAEIKKSPTGSGKMLEVSWAIREGAMAFLKRQYKTVAIAAAVLFLIILLTLGIKSAFGFLIGALASAFSGFVGMNISTQANVKVAEMAKKGLGQALSLAFKGGSVTGFLVAGLGLLSVSVFYW